jgi:hypothetical protein
MTPQEQSMYSFCKKCSTRVMRSVRVCSHCDVSLCLACAPPGTAVQRYCEVTKCCGKQACINCRLIKVVCRGCNISGCRSCVPVSCKSCEKDYCKECDALEKPVRPRMRIHNVDEMCRSCRKVYDETTQLIFMAVLLLLLGILTVSCISLNSFHR